MIAFVSEIEGNGLGLGRIIFSIRGYFLKKTFFHSGGYLLGERGGVLNTAFKELWKVLLGDPCFFNNSSTVGNLFIKLDEALNLNLAYQYQKNQRLTLSVYDEGQDFYSQ